MKKSLKKAILTLAAVVVVSAAMAVSAFAASITGTISDDNKTLTLKVTDAAAEKQVTVLVLKDGADDTAPTAETIAYLNQDAADKDGTLTYTITLSEALTKGTYKIKVGGEDGTIGTSELVVGGEPNPGPSEDVMIGDVTGDGKINSLDALDIMYYELEVLDSFKGSTNILIGDVTNDTKVNSLDALDIMYYELEVLDSFKRTSL